MTAPDAKPWEQVANPGTMNAADRLSQLVAGNAALTTEPGLVQALDEGNATPVQAQAINQFLVGLKAEQKVRVASAAAQRIVLSPDETSALDAMGINYAPVYQSPQSALETIKQQMADKGVQPVMTADGQFQMKDGQVVVHPLAKPAPKAKPKPSGWFDSVGGFFHHLTHNPVTNLVGKGSLDPNNAFEQSVPEGGVQGLLKAANTGWNYVSATVQDEAEWNKSVQSYVAAQQQNSNLAQKLGYDPGSFFSMQAFKAHGYEHTDLSHLAGEWDQKYPSGLAGMDGNTATQEAALFAANPTKWRQAILNDASNYATDSSGRQTLTEQGQQKLNLLANKDFQGLIAQVQSRQSSIGNEVANSLGIDPIKHPTERAFVNGGSEIAASFALDPLGFGINAATQAAKSSVAINGLADGERIRQILTAEDGIKSMQQANQIAHLKDLIQSAKDFREATNEGAEVAASKIVGRLEASNPFAGYLAEFTGDHQVLGFHANPVRGESPFVMGKGTPIEDYQQAVDYLAGWGGFVRLTGGRSVVDSRLMPGAMSSYGFSRLKGALANWSSGRTLGRLRNAADEFTGWAQADPGRLETLINEGYLTRYDPHLDDAVDSMTGNMLFPPSVEITDKGLGLIRRNELTYGGNPEQMSAVGRIIGWGTKGMAARARVAITRLSNQLPTSTKVHVDSNASVWTIRKIARTYLPQGQADLLAAHWVSGNAVTRKTVIEGLKDQIAEAAGLSKTRAGRELTQSWKTDNQAYNLRPDLEWPDANGVPAANWPGQVQTSFNLPAFGQVHHAAVKAGLYEATLGRMLTSASLDKLMGQWKIGALARPITAVRAILESQLNAAAEGLYGKGLRAKAMARDLGRLDEPGLGLARLRGTEKLAQFGSLAGVARLYRDVLRSDLTPEELQEHINFPLDLEAMAIHEQSAFHQAMTIDPAGLSDLTKAAELGLKPGRVTFNTKNAWDGRIRERSGYELTDEVFGARGADMYAHNLATRVNDNPELAKAVIRLLGGDDRVLYHGGLPEDAKLSDIDLNHLGAQQNKSGKSYGGFYLANGSSRDLAQRYALDRNAALHEFHISSKARLGDLGRRNIDRLTAQERADLAEQYDYIKGADAFGHTQYVLLNKSAVQSMKAVDTDAGPYDEIIGLLDRDPMMKHTLYGKNYKGGVSVYGKNNLSGEAVDAAVEPWQVTLGKQQWAQSLAGDMEKLLRGRDGQLNQKIIDHINRFNKAPQADWILKNVKDLQRPESLLAPLFTDSTFEGTSDGLVKKIFEAEGRAYQRLVEMPIQRHATLPLFRAATVDAKLGLNATLKPQLIEAGFSPEVADRFAWDIAAGQGWNRVARMLDDPHMKTQMDIVGRGFFAFSRATTMMLRRWGSTFWRNPVMARRLQLAVEGSTQSGIAHKDENGDWVTSIPLSGVAMEVLQHAMSYMPWFSNMVYVPTLDLQGRVTTAIPGSDNPLQYSTTPMVSLPARWIASHFPEHREWFDYIDQKLNGKLGQGRGIVDTLEPSIIKSLITDPGFVGSTDPEAMRNQMLASAMVGQLYTMYAAGKAPTEAEMADPAKRQKWLDEYKRGVMSNLFTKGIFGMFGPMTLTSPEGSGFPADEAWRVTGAQDLRAEYKEILNDVGGDSGRANAVWQRLHPDLMVFTQSGSQGTTKDANLPSTDAAFKWMADNKGFIDNYKDVAAYFLPPAKANAPFSLDAFHAQIEEGMRQRKTPDEFLTGIKLSSDISTYFDGGHGFPGEAAKNKALAAAQAAKDQNMVRYINDQWSIASKNFQESHPLFQAWLQDHSKGGVTAGGQVRELKRMVQDNQVPGDPKNALILKGMIAAYDGYEQYVTDHPGTTNVATAQRQMALGMYQDYLAKAITEAPELAGIYNGVFRVLNSNLDQLTVEGQQ